VVRKRSGFSSAFDPKEPSKTSSCDQHLVIQSDTTVSHLTKAASPRPWNSKGHITLLSATNFDNDDGNHPDDHVDGCTNQAGSGLLISKRCVVQMLFVHLLRELQPESNVVVRDQEPKHCQNDGTAGCVNSAALGTSETTGRTSTHLLLKGLK